MTNRHENIAPDPLIAEAIEICGNQRRLARGAKVSQTLINRMLWRERSVTANAAVGIHRATDGRVPKWKLRPDLFDAPADSQPNGS